MAKLKELFALLGAISNLFLVNSFALGLPHVNPGKIRLVNTITVWYLVIYKMFQIVYSEIFVKECRLFLRDAVICF